METTAYISLGSNLGDSRETLLRAIERLREYTNGVVVCSSFWQTEPVDCPPGSPPFVNAAAGFPVKAGETPETLLAKLRQMEIEFGRKPKLVLNEPRPLDLDLICFGGEVRQTAELVLPHPRAHLRRFVLQPFSELAPELILPGQKMTIRELLMVLPSGQGIARL